MKQIILIVMLVCSIQASAQPIFEQQKPASSVFNPDSGTATGETFTISNFSADVFTTANGAKYIKAISKAGNTYAVWIGELTDYLFEGKPVYQFKSGKYAIYKLNKQGYPYPVYLKINNV